MTASSASRSDGALVVDRGDDFSSLKLLASGQMDATAWGNVSASQHVERAFELRREIVIQQLSRLLGRSLNGVARRLIHGARRSLDNHLLAGADQARTLLPNAGESGIELLFGLNSSGEVAAKLHGRDAIAVNDAVQLGYRILQTVSQASSSDRSCGIGTRS